MSRLYPSSVLTECCLVPTRPHRGPCMTRCTFPLLFFILFPRLFAFPRPEFSFPPLFCHGSGDFVTQRVLYVVSGAQPTPARSIAKTLCAAVPWAACLRFCYSPSIPFVTLFLSLYFCTSVGLSGFAFPVLKINSVSLFR